MILTVFYVVLAILGLSLLIFLHELGHYYMARRLGMHVEIFSIGFGKPLYQWKRDGVQWQIGWLLFGGYVKIKEMDPAEEKHLVKPEDVVASAWKRIKVAFTGPFVNIVFAFLAFTLIWAFGGRDKKFSDYTRKIGWIDPKSELYAQGVRIGDEIASYNHQPFNSGKDHLTVPMTSKGEVLVEGYHLNLETQSKTPFSHTVKTYSHPEALDKDVLTVGILHPASYLVYDPLKEHTEGELLKNSPMEGSGIESGDRIVWVDGFPIYSMEQLSHLLNDSKVLLTIQRGSQLLLARVPRIKVEELKLAPAFKDEIMDWQFEANLKGTRLQNLYAIPYDLSYAGVVEGRLRFIDGQKKEQEVFSGTSALEAPLKNGDRIIAVDGSPVSYAYQILGNIQKHSVNIIVQKGKDWAAPSSFKTGDLNFDQEYRLADLNKLAQAVGVTQEIASSGNLQLLRPITPKMRREFFVNGTDRAMLEALETQRKEIEQINDPEKRAHVKQWFEIQEKKLLLGIPGLSDRVVGYNPNPIILFKQVVDEIRHTLSALLTGSLHPKWMSGPLGIVQVVQEHSRVGLKESLFWLGAISLNLGILNLLPLPVLDGGTICFSIYEIITKRRLKQKTLEKLMLPFAVLLIGFFIFLTYHDLARILKQLWH